MSLFSSTEVSPRRRSLSSVPGSEKSGIVENPNLSPFRVAVSEASVAVAIAITGTSGHPPAGGLCGFSFIQDIVVPA